VEEDLQCDVEEVVLFGAVRGEESLVLFELRPQVVQIADADRSQPAVEVTEQLFRAGVGRRQTESRLELTSSACPVSFLVWEYDRNKYSPVRTP
jgi:hypothetical protein